MKICRYKGPNREALYKTIHDEMGPNAVVVTPESSGSSLFGKSRQFELIAILDESQGAAPPAARTATPAEEEELKRLRRQQSRQWRDIQEQLNHIQETIKTLHVHPPDDESDGLSVRGVPPHAKHWDPRFCAWARQACPAALEHDTGRATRALARTLKVAEEFSFEDARRQPHIIVLVGPTGSGKTTTLAKLAAICSMQHHLNVGIVTADTFRVAAVDQIREYASLLDTELRVIFSAEEARSAVSGLSHNDVILVDTPGRAHSDDLGLSTVHRVLKGMGAITVMLALPASLNRIDLPDVLAGFARFEPNHIIVTKLDETRCPAIFTSLPFETECTVAFLTNGQRVPQDILAARPARMAEYLMASAGPPAEQQEAPANTAPSGKEMLA